MTREPMEAMNLIDNMARNQQWSGRDNSRPGGGGKFEVDQITALSAKLDAMQRAMDKMSMKAVEQQPQACVMCGDERHAYEQCPSNNNPPSNNNWNNASGSNNRNFYQNTSFPNQNNRDRAPPAGPPKPTYVPPYATNFTHEQGKLNQMMWEQMQSMSAQMASQNKLLEQLSHMVISRQPQPGKLPSQPEPNPRGEAKAITLRSGTQYDEPPFPTDQNPSDATCIESDATRITADATHIQDDVTRVPDKEQGSDPVNATRAPDFHSMRPASDKPERQKGKEAETPPPYRPPVPFPRRLAETKLNAQFDRFIEVLKGQHISIPFTEALTQMPTYAKFLKDILSNK